MANPRIVAVFLTLGTLCYAAETWVVRAGQRDPGAVEELLERASRTGARVWRDGDRFLVAGALGDWPREIGVAVEPLAGTPGQGAIRTTDFAPQGSVRGTGSVVTLDHAENATFLGTSFLLDRVEGVAWAADGTVVLDSAYAGGSSARALNFARQFNLRATLVESARPAYELKRPRLGLAARDAWVARLFERYTVPYTSAAGGGWREKFDTVVVGSGEDIESSNQFALGGGTVVRLPSGMGAEFTRATFELNEPVAFGMPALEWVRSATETLSRGRIIARFEQSGQAAIAEEASGNGRVISFSFQPDTYATCRLLLNAVYLGSARRL